MGKGMILVVMVFFILWVNSIVLLVYVNMVLMWVMFVLEVLW